MFIFDRLDTLIDREPFIFIGWGGLIPQGILFTDGNLQNNLITLGLLIDRSDRSILSNANFDRQHMPPVLWQSLRAKEHSSGPKLSKGDEYIDHFLC